MEGKLLYSRVVEALDGARRRISARRQAKELPACRSLAQRSRPAAVLIAESRLDQTAAEGELGAFHGERKRRQRVDAVPRGRMTTDTSYCPSIGTFSNSCSIRSLG